MPVQIADTLTQVAFTASSQQWIIAPGVNAGGGVESAFGSSTLTNYGNVLSSTAAVHLLSSSGFVHNIAGALIAGSSGLWLEAGATRVRNAGTIHGTTNYGILAVNSANDLTIENLGSIWADNHGIWVNAPAALTVGISNSGTIAGDQTGMALSGAADAAPVIFNSGTIKGIDSSISAFSGDRLNVTNTGSLIGDVSGSSIN